MSSLRVSPTQLSDLQYNTDHVRNICIIAHIDHGKTTLADNIICSNGIISQKMAGKLRFLDSTDDEQKRGITMYSSAISLLYSMEPMANMLGLTPASGSKKERDEYLVNLVDSPGHIDFSSDVSTATRLCDGALLVVDVLEGICPQTHAVLYKALKDRMHPVLVLNKIDKLILELHLSPLEAFHHLRRIIERVNALASTLLNSELRARDAVDPQKDDAEDDTEDPLIAIWNFAPELGNVVFASAIDGWAFNIGRFALYWAKQLSLNKNIVQKHMFDDYAFNKSTKKIVKVDSSNINAKPMFVTMILEPIWQIYDVAITQQNGEKAAKMAARLGVEIAKRDIYGGGGKDGKPRGHQTGASSTTSASNEAYRGTLQAIMRAWLPLADAVLRTVVRVIPDPATSQQLKSEHFFASQNIHELSTACDHNSLTKKGVSKSDIIDTIRKVNEDVTACRRGSSSPRTTESEDFEVQDDVNTVVFIAKMVPVRIADLSPKDAESAIQSIRSAKDKEHKGGDGDGDGETSNVYDHTTENINNTEVFLALGRVFSGTLTAKSSGSVYCLGNHHNPFEHDSDSSVLGEDETSPAGGGGTGATTGQRVPLSALTFYMCLGPAVLPVEAVPAGNIVCIFGLQEYVLKSSTLCSTPLSLPMKAITFQTKPMLRVAVEPKNHYNLRDLEAGLQQLYQYDPVVEIGVDDLGQSTITCLGELHLELCLKALSEKFAKCEVVASAPLVPFRETVVTASPPISSTVASIIASSPAGLETILPPPWNDLSGISQVRRLLPTISGGSSNPNPHAAAMTDASLSYGAIHRLVVSSQMVSITFRCFSLPSTVVNFLTPGVDEVTSSNAHVISEYIASHKSGKKHMEDNGADMLRSMNVAWDQLSQMILSGGGADMTNNNNVVDHCLLDAFDREQHHLNKLSTEEEASKSETQPLPSLFNRMISLGPHGAGPNMLLFSPEVCLEVYEDTVSPPEDDDNTDTSEGSPSTISDTSKLLAVLTQKSSAAQTTTEQKDKFEYIWSRLRGSVVSGFQMLTASGPLMQEPLQGVCFSIEKIEISARVSGLDEKELQAVIASNGVTATATSTTKSESESESGQLETPSLPQSIMFSTGQLISDVRESLRLCMLGCALRLVEPIYKCSLQCDQLQLGNLYAVLSRRRGEVTDEDIIEGTSLFILTVSLPVANSFGFAQELLHKTSGSGTAPQLFFSHWSINDQDPFWKPTTSDEQEEHGMEGGVGGGQNLPRSFIDGVRRRKGLVVEEKLVVYAEKQRTLTRNK